MKDGFEQVDTLTQLRGRIDSGGAIAVYFAGHDCGVCSVLEPKLSELFSQQFPKMETWIVKSNVQPEIAAAFTVFAVPTLLVFFETKEWFRKSRNVSLAELQRDIHRPYDMVFPE